MTEQELFANEYLETEAPLFTERRLLTDPHEIDVNDIIVEEASNVQPEEKSGYFRMSTFRDIFTFKTLHNLRQVDESKQV